MRVEHSICGQKCNRNSRFRVFRAPTEKVRIFCPNVHTILDIGGQDSKAIRLNDNGEVADFVMNDKCAAGTGRFLEMMARSLEISIDELGQVSLQSKENIEISSMCSVFAE